ncbi:hypothetical protein BH24GEM3_BH24GEM3_24230 [soil metagenome]
MSERTVSIHYRRLPDAERIFEQRLVEDAGEYVVTLLDAAPLPRPVVVAERTVLEPGAPVVWFTYPGRWYDIGRFHLADGTFTGYYANILTPVRMQGDCWDTTDLCLDVWKGSDGRVGILDELEFEEAVECGWIDAPTAAAAREHAETLALAARQGVWPAPHVDEWDLERARGRLAGGGGR